MNNLIAYVLIAAVVAVPTVAIAKASQFRLPAAFGAIKRALSFDPRHPGLSYDPR